MVTALYFLSGLALLFLGGEALVRGAAAIGMRIGMTPLVAGLTIVAFATSAPELAVSLDAALRGAPGLAVGNVIGSNICNITLVAGIAAVVKPARLRDQLIRRDVLVMLMSTLLVPGLLLDGALTRVEGGLLLIGIIGYVGLTVWHARTNRHIDPFESISVPLLSEHLLINLGVTSVGVAMLIFGSRLFVAGSVDIALLLGVPAAVVGLSAAALGTSLPEVSASVVSARHGHPEMAAGNVIGSNIFNLLLILGGTSVVRPLSTDGVGAVDLGVMIGVSVLALALMLTKSRIERHEGGLMVAVYIGYLVWLFGSLAG
jgi:cation:H+ antiporter